jgi:hypothetical protein
MAAPKNKGGEHRPWREDGAKMAARFGEVEKLSEKTEADEHPSG